MNPQGWFREENSFITQAISFYFGKGLKFIVIFAENFSICCN